MFANYRVWVMRARPKFTYRLAHGSEINMPMWTAVVDFYTRRPTKIIFAVANPKTSEITSLNRWRYDMNINMPGYTAEASLNTRGGHQWVAGADVPIAEVAPQAVALRQTVSPGTGGQRFFPDWWRCWYFGSCMICCNPWWCWWACWGAAAQAMAP